ncbi:hypothetical protein Bca52824_034886 [Brassica carinata]|uniref:F-box domain-containing protein n=1 Tax=Brassica carinata TaxID=52824 RepID=A0A8X7S0T8_BRACI|nr:hypothetical protein Bca52824_034886 [Brassica carinata]
MDLIMEKVKRQEVVRSTDWSKLSPDVLRKIFETLSPLDSHRSKLVCSDWYSVWKTCDNLPPCPLQIVHIGGSPILSERQVYRREPDDGQDLHKNPRLIIREGGGSSRWSENIHYPRKLAGQNLSRSSCMASYGSWLLMVDDDCDIHLLNLITFEKINLPTMTLMPERDIDRRNWERGPLSRRKVTRDDLQRKNAAVLWIDDRSGDYFVAWIFRQTYLVSHKKGEDSWSRMKIHGSVFMDAAYRNSTLYVLTADQHIIIFDCSRDLPRQLNAYMYLTFRFDEKPWESIWKTRLAIKESGEVLIILSLKELKNDQEKLLFYVFKMNIESCKWERVYSIGDNEMLIFGQGVTVKAPVKDRFGHGIKSGTINFVEDDVGPHHDDHHDSVCGVFDLAKSRIEWPKKTCYYISRTQWFVPGVAYY